MNGFLTESMKIDVISAAVVAGTSLVTSNALDMQGYDGVAFLALLGDVLDTSVLTLTGKENDTNSNSGGTTISGATAAFTADATSADSKAIVVDVLRPTKRYVYCTLARATANAVVNSLVAILYQGHNLPISNSDLIALTKVAAQ